MALGIFKPILLRLWINGCALRHAGEEGTEAAPPAALQVSEAPSPGHFGKARSAFLEVESDTFGQQERVILARTGRDLAHQPDPHEANYPPCDGLPSSGSHVIGALFNLSTSCTWHGHPGLQVALEKPLSFQGSLVLTGEIQLMGTATQETDGPCITVHGKMSMIAANVSFVGCRNGLKDGKGGALFIYEDLIASKSNVKFENCAALGHGGGLYTQGSLFQEGRSTMVFESCTAADDGGGADVVGNFTQGPNSSAIFRSCKSKRRNGGGLRASSYTQGAGSSVLFEHCSARYGGGLFLTQSYKQELGSSAVFDNCEASFDGGGVCVQNGGFRQGPNSSVHFRSCAAARGGGIFVAQDYSYQQEVGSSAVFQNCSATSRGGGLYTEGSFFQDGPSTVVFESCTADTAKNDRDGGGGAYVKNMSIGRNCSAHFRDCTADETGGGLFSNGYRQEAGSSAIFENCAAANGGGLRAVTFQQEAGSSATFDSCRAEKSGGGVKVQTFFRQGHNSSLRFRACAAEGGRGGGLIAEHYQQEAGSSAAFEDCSAEYGGGLNVEKSYRQEEGSSVLLVKCTAEEGGGVWAPNFTQGPGSSASFQGCRAQGKTAKAPLKLRGGGMFIVNSYQQEAGSSAVFQHCTAKQGGGVYVAKSYQQEAGSSAMFENCSAENGGGLVAESYWQAVGASADFENCTAERGEGGGLYTTTLDGHGSMHFQACRAKAGGGLCTSELDGNGSIHFETCRAEAGGGLSVREGGRVHHEGALEFQACNASFTGGGLYSSASRGQFGKLRFERCDAAVVAAAFAAIDVDDNNVEVQIQELWLLNGGRSNLKDLVVTGVLKIGSAHLTMKSKFGAYIQSQDLVLEDVVDCTWTTTCKFSANVAQRAGFRCPLGAGLVDFKNSDDFGCFACTPGKTQILNMTTRPCSRCPDGAEQCWPSQLEMEAGMMVELDNVSRSFHCPNEAACPGGSVSQGRLQRAMCATGYQGQGCATCSERYAVADRSVLSCKACSEVRRIQVIQWILFLAQRTILFGIGAFSALLAKKAGDLKNSSIYLNQLMAFATISNTIMAAVLQTKTAKSVKSQAINFFFDATIAMDETASGQGSLLSASSQCLLSYIGYEKTIWGCHLLDIVVAAVFMGSLSLVKDFRAALIAGINCFLPTIAAGFGKYLVCYRVERNELVCPFLPGNYALVGAMQVLVGFILLMGAAFWTWLRLSRSEEDPLPSHVVFLTSKYRPEFALFEMERLARKTLITFIGACLPIESASALQIGCLGTVVLGAQLLYCRCHPYHNSEWNWIEISLLSAAMVMIIGVSTLLANESHWGHTLPTQLSIILGTALIAAVASTIMTYRVIRELIREHSQK